MAIVLPFKSLRFNSEKIGDLADLIAPPYDVIYDDDQIELENRHPNNIVRLILSQPRDHDTETDNKYTRAADLFRKWIESGIFSQDDKKYYYVYDQTFTISDEKTYTRRALIAIGKLENFEDRVVLPHEKTLAAPKADRLNLMRQTDAQLSPIFLLYSDHDGEIESEMKNFTNVNNSIIDIPDRFGSTHRVWRIDDDTINRKIENAFDQKTLLIADGHHRYETALAFRDEMRSKSENWTENENYNFVMMNLVRMESDGLAVLPINRVLRDLDPEFIKNAIADLSNYFEIETFADQSSLCEHLKNHAGDRPAYGFYDGGKNYRLLIAPKPPKDLSNLDRLDVKILHDKVIKDIFGIDITKPEDQKKISYTADTAKAIEMVRSGRSQIAFLMNATQPLDVHKVALDGETMPQKSTFFYPKLATGITIHLLK